MTSNVDRALQAMERAGILTSEEATRRQRLIERHARVLCHFDGLDPDAKTDPRNWGMPLPNWVGYGERAVKELEAVGWPDA
jgi:hypothetical protein